jgi:hypothetical protein
MRETTKNAEKIDQRRETNELNRALDGQSEPAQRHAKNVAST